MRNIETWPSPSKGMSPEYLSGLGYCGSGSARLLVLGLPPPKVRGSAGKSTCGLPVAANAGTGTPATVAAAPSVAVPRNARRPRLGPKFDSSDELATVALLLAGHCCRNQMSAQAFRRAWQDRQAIARKLERVRGIEPL